MKIDVDELSPVQRRIRVELPAETVNSEFLRAYQQLNRRVRIKGFRAGKAPRRVLEGLYGNEIKGQVRSQLVEDSLGEIFKQRGLQVVSRPEIEANELEEDRIFSFSAVVEVKPDIEVKDYLGIDVEKVRLSVEEAQVDEALRRLQESHAQLELVDGRDVVQRDDFVIVDFTGFIAGKPFAGNRGENYQLEVGGGQALPQFEDAMVGLKRGEQQTLQIAYPENHFNKELAGKLVDFSVVVREIKQKVLPPLDDEFAKDHGECASLDELKKNIRARLANELKLIQDEELKEQILNRLIETHSFEPPPAMVEGQTRYLMERHQDRVAAAAETTPAPPREEIRKNLQARALRQVRATLLVEKIAEHEKIDVSDIELQERIDALARAGAERGKTVREIYSRPDARNDLRAQMIFGRTLGFLLERAKVKEVDLPSQKG
ncbi:MAG TPA: trigger factor [Candidatus Binatia bacterium]|nr:trigger factor [Candidatus Binatia bacterium]